MYHNFPEELRKKKQWVLWKQEQRSDGKSTKVPYQPNGRKAASTRPEEWSSFEECLEKVHEYSGLGFVFHEGVVGIDLDHCVLETGDVAPWAREVLEQFPSYTELSPSGRGLHIIVLNEAVLDGRKKDHVECYSHGRFFTVTGNVFEGRDLLRALDVKPWYTETFGEEKTGDDEENKEGPAVELPSDETILRVMFSSKNGIKMKALYQTGDWEKQRYSSQSSADLALVGALMFFCGNDRSTVDRLFRGSRLYRAKWDEKRGALTYGQKTMNEAVSRETMRWDSARVDFIMSSGEHPAPLLIAENIYRAMNSVEEMRNKYRLNDFSHMTEVLHGDEWKSLGDMDVLEAVRWVVNTFSFFAKVSKDVVTDAIKLVANDHKVNPQLDYFLGLSWDGVPRLDKWLVEAFGAPDDELHRKIGSNWLKGLVKRVIEPGCIFDEVLVLEGKQGTRKSTAMRVLGAPWHTECTLSMDDREFYMLLARNVIVEFSEGEIVGRTSAQKLKAVITKTEDTYRPPYERGTITFKRSCVFAMTTNNKDYQKDDTGGRRWLPVVLGKEADIDWLKANRDQLFAEAMHRVTVLKETTHEYPKEELMALQAEKTEEDSFDEPIRDWYDELPESVKREGIRLIDAYENVVEKDESKRRPMDKKMEWRIGGIFRRVLGLEILIKKVGDKSIRRWVKK